MGSHRDSIPKPRKNLTRLYVVRWITQDFYDKKFKEYKNKQNDILTQSERHSKADETYYIEATKVLELASRAYELFEKADLEEKRELLKYLFQNSNWNGKSLDITLQKPFDVILSHAKTQNWLPG
ncbi:MAG: hypothetical protein WD231_05275 [Candidatus Woykebacteria bacterium]